ncbi:uncharacterized protein GGS22DRAFT_131045 [Annulohypoxylon maeteangense]|uniref:uncharacterized protein n=1 Tax=Annulohypoxylon maeteangense TaxID=1927788 RepID=UPI002007F28F|nr:uncharacterized protein GGS22DRAFT_131045 [Annulohypoxylon maeteangense]KAI0885596.1 hypothetical protein GGS22DRAFT_131045 [Annulohypoxylon maeteangense]
MTAKAKPSNPLNGMHTAGIFSDMSVDGPDIGTLVLIVDRAKNLPNRKTIGKQDPYCAARLAKEAKKTTTDIRGGQTPKWDQELRFNVHDSPDYYQLKLSVFNDDRKTELIGETWIDLRDIIVRGGGQSDQWHILNCKGKYAGEVRIEITFYDSRPKLEKPVAKANVGATSSDPDAIVGSQKTAVKRRPLPSDPVTGQVPSPSVTELVHTPSPRAQPNPQATFIPNPASLQAIEYGTSPSNRPSNLHDQYAQVQNQYSTPPHRAEHPQYRTLDRNYKFPTQENEHSRYLDSHARTYEPDPRASFNSYESPSSLVHQPRQSIENDDCPPPPPVHRVRNSSGTSHELVPRGAFDTVQHKATPPMRHDVLRSEAHRYSVSSPSSSYPGRPTYRPFESAPEVQGAVQYHDSDIGHQAAPRHYSYDSAYESHHRSMQPTVEDVPETWTPPSARGRLSGSRALEYDEREFHQGPSPAPLNLGGRGSAGSGHYSPSPLPSQQQYESNGFSPSPEPMASEDYSQALTLVSRPYSNYNEHSFRHPSELEDNQVHTPGDYDLAPVPPTLVPGVDPALAREISDRFHQERKQGRRYTQPIPVDIPSRGRQQSDPPSNYLVKYSPNAHYAANSRSYERSVVPYSSGPTTPSVPVPVTRPRGTSPNPSANRTIKRKSVSPAPPPSDGRRLSGIPFGPDSYDALNPTVTSKDASSSEYTNAEGKIVTSDGREVDPSDHLPMESWAPEPEPKKPTESLQTRSRPIPAGAQPMPPSGRRPPRELARPQSMAGLPTTYTTSEMIPSPPASTGRARLQKKTHRASALPAAISSGSSPLGPSTPHQRNSTPPRALVRASTFDYENHGPGGARTGYGSGPPIPAKVPMMSGGLGPSSGRGGEEWALMEEMSRIDIGTGRARRHGGY